MPYSLSPPSFGRASKTVTSWPSIARRWAQARPAGPPPTTATRLPRRRRARWNGCIAALEQLIGGIALQRADLDRLVLRAVAHAGLLAQRLGRADPRAHAAQDVLLEDGHRRALEVAGGDLADEARDVDAGRAGLDAGRVVAEVAAARFDQRALARRAADGRRRSCGRSPPAPAARRRCPARIVWPCERCSLPVVARCA